MGATGHHMYSANALPRVRKAHKHSELSFMTSRFPLSQWLVKSTAITSVLILIGCSSGGENTIPTSTTSDNETENVDPQMPVDTSGNETVSPLDLSNPFDYANQLVPNYITKDNTTTNGISNAGATLGRVLFYDKKLSNNDSISCGSCHQQSLGFSDNAQVSVGVNGVTSRHSMRLVNTRFSIESQFFWDERAATLEQQTTQPIRDHTEMGFGGTEGDPDFDVLIQKLTATDYYPPLFVAAFGNELIDEDRMQRALAQFIRSIQSFDSRYDQGRAAASNNGAMFGNFTTQENEGKRLFTQAANFDANSIRTPGTGLGCNDCHRAPEFDIDPSSRNNGVIDVALNLLLATDITNTRSPSLRDVFNNNGTDNGPFMHTGELATINDVLDHYNDITIDRNINPNIDNVLSGNPRGAAGQNNGTGQKLMLVESERAAMIAFLKTLSGNALYTNPQWSDPFDAEGNLQNVLSQQ